MRLRVFLTLLVTLLCACDTDPFEFNHAEISGPYYLEKQEMGYFYLRGPSNQEEVYGVISGTVNAIGWSTEYIVVKQNGDGLGEGWIIIDVSAQSVGQLLSETQLEQVPNVTSVTLRPADVVWRDIKGGDA